MAANPALALESMGYRNLIDFEVHDEGKGPYLKVWNHSDRQPTMQEIEAYAQSPAYKTTEDERTAYAELEALIVAKKRELAIAALKKEGKIPKKLEGKI